MGTTQSDEFGRGTVVAANDASVVASVHTIGDVLDLHVDVAGGHIAPNARADVVSELFELPAVKMSRRLHAAFPIGDYELVLQLQGRCVSLHTRAAGATCLIEAELPGCNE